MDTIKINVGGVVFETTHSTLKSLPNTRLGNLDRSSNEYNPEKQQFFFDRNSDVFGNILDLYRTGELHMPLNVCGATFRRELEFWQIKPELMEECCLKHFYMYENDKAVLKILKTSFKNENADGDAPHSLHRTIKLRIWRFFDNPSSSIPATIFGYVFMALVVTTSLMFFLQFHPNFRVPINSGKYQDAKNTTYNRTEGDYTNSWNPKLVFYLSTSPMPFIIVLEDISLYLFTIEFLFHFGSCPNYCLFFKSLLNCLDAIVLVIMWTVFGLEKNILSIINSETAITAYIYLKAFMILRLLRLLRLMKQYKGLKILYLALFSSSKELMLMFITFIIMALFFASFMFYAEFRQPDTFPSIFLCIWWAIVTMTTVGYGDTYPKSTSGYAVGSVCALFGVLILALPIAVVASRFSDLYDRHTEIELHEKQKKKSSLTAAVHPDELKVA